MRAAVGLKIGSRVHGAANPICSHTCFHVIRSAGKFYLLTEAVLNSAGRTNLTIWLFPHSNYSLARTHCCYKYKGPCNINGMSLQGYSQCFLAMPAIPFMHTAGWSLFLKNRNGICILQQYSSYYFFKKCL